MDVRVQEAGFFGNAKQKAILSKSRKFQNPSITANGQKRAEVMLTDLRTLWFNTGSLCNIACVNCYMGSSPVNNDLVYLSLNDVRRYLDEVEHEGYGLEEVGFTGGEPLVRKDLAKLVRMVSQVSGIEDISLSTNAVLLAEQGPELRDAGVSRVNISLDSLQAERVDAISRRSGSFERIMKGLEVAEEMQFS